MTLCIAAMASVPTVLEPCFVLCFDTKVATEFFSSETEHKFHVLSNTLVAVVADRPGRAKELAVQYRERFAKAVPTDADILNLLRDEIPVLKRKIASGYLGRTLGVTYEDFRTHGVQWFGQDRFDKYMSVIEGNPLGVEMIVAGFLGPLRS